MSEPPRTRTRRITGSYNLGRVKTKELAKRKTQIQVDMEDVEGIAAFFQELIGMMRGSKSKKIVIIVEEVE